MVNRQQNASGAAAAVGGTVAGGVVRQRVPEQIWVLVAAAFIIALGYGLIAPILPQFVVTFDVSLAAASAVVSVFAGTRLLFAPVSGRLIDRIGSRKVYLTGLATVAVTTGLVALAQDYWQVLLLRALAGVGSTMFTVSAMGLIVRMAPAEIRGRCSSVYASAFLFGSIIGPVLGAAMSALGMRPPFAIYGASVALAALVVWWRMPRTDAPLSTGTTRQVEPLHFRETIRDSAYRSALVGAFANGWSNFGVRVATLPLFVAAVFDNGGAAAGFAMAAFAAGNAICLQLSGTLSDTHGRKPLIISGLVINSVFTASLGFADQFWLLIALSAMAGVGAGLMNPSQQAVLGDVIGSGRPGGRILANFQMAQDFGAITGPILVGMIAQSLGFHYGFLLCGAIGLCAAAYWFLGRETLPSAQQQGTA
ncbi:MFS transporter [Corynebacterium pacaense]|uniref:MFS transporter n=1 Tax=Corynebacterium pacaense TaxID=1816684 RepID=UPI0009BB0036|nr:MFS transporter [Corynebacterium pacaense]